jgi:glucosylceramidase
MSQLNVLPNQVFKSYLYILLCISPFLSCAKKNSDTTTPGTHPNIPATTVDSWLTTADQSSLLQKQATPLAFDSVKNPYPFLDVDSTQKFQPIDGFGFTLTGGSAYVINQMSSSSKATLLNELFGKDASSVSISYLRLSIGASDLNATVFSYDDMPSGQTDLTLTHFTLGPDTVDLIPVLKQILAINPSIKIIATPWSPPLWMKDNGSSVGGSLLSSCYDVYAQYFVKYIQEMKTLGIPIDAVTPQNEPLNPANNPSLSMVAADESAFIKNNLGPAFHTAGLTTKIIVYDHNCDVPGYATTILSDPATASFVDGSAFHLYAGDISALGQVHAAYPDKNLYFTEQYTSSTGSFAGDLQWHMTNVIIGSTKNWSRNALEWNLATDPNYGPHTNGGCTVCKAAITIDVNTVTRNVGYYIVAHASKFVPPGSVRIGSTLIAQVPNVAFETPSGGKILIAVNNSASSAAFNLRFKSKWVTVFLPASAASTFVW